jgi:hypothetical protein
VSGIRLVDAGAVRPSTYNPRQADPRRLALVELSLRKLGFLLPLHADAGGELLSGHQRHHVYTDAMGGARVPVHYAPAMDLETRKAVNIGFNRGTNDMPRDSTPQDLTAALEALRIEELAAALPDLTPDTPEFFPCVRVEHRPIRPLLKANAGRWVVYARNMARLLRGKGIVIPIVVGPDGRVVNGIGRLEDQAAQKAATVPVVEVSAEAAEFAGAMLNLLSMDFDLHTRYEDLLRYNSFRRARRSRKGLGRGFVFPLVGKKAANTFDITRAADRKRWVQRFGRSVVDFGAGHLHETAMLREAGVYVTAFEPYRLGGGNEIDKPASITLARAFLQDVAAGREWSSVFIASVLNSVPFAEDRRHVVAICAALCGRGTSLYACASSTKQSAWENVNGADYISDVNGATVQFRLGYEPGITIGDFGSRPKVQKHHTAREFHQLLAERFGWVGVQEASNNVEAECRQPRPLDPGALRSALAFEFDLPYPDGTRMGLVDEAHAAFSQRLGVTL